MPSLHNNSSLQRLSAGDDHILAQIVDAAPIAMAVFADPDHRFRLANPAFVALADGRPVIDRSYREVFPALAAAHLPRIEQVYTGRTVVIDKVSLDMGDSQGAEESCWQFTFVPLCDAERSVVGVQCYGLAQAGRDQESLTGDDKDTFLSIVGHELRTPLTTMKGLTQMAQRRLIDAQDLAKARNNLALASQQITRMETLIDRLLDVTRIQSGELPLEIERCDLGDLVRAAVLRTQAMTDQHSLKLRGDEADLPVDVDPQRIEQVLNNLFWNAVKFAPSGGQVLVTIEAAADGAIVWVSDSGIGIPPKGRERLFERFYRGSNAPAQHFSGLGIGLYLSMQIVKRHRGRLWLEETGASGSIFALELPLARTT